MKVNSNSHHLLFTVSFPNLIKGNMLISMILIRLSTLLSEITHTTGLSLNLHLNAIKIKSLDMFYHLKLQKNQLFLAQ